MIMIMVAIGNDGCDGGNDNYKNDYYQMIMNGECVFQIQKTFFLKIFSKIEKKTKKQHINIFNLF